MIIIDGRRRLHIRIKDWDYQPPEDEVQESPVRSFGRWWRERLEERRMPYPKWTGEDYGIAARLLKKHGEKRLKELALSFLRWHGDPLYDGYGHPMRLLAAKLPEVEAQLRGDYDATR